MELQLLNDSFSLDKPLEFQGFSIDEDDDNEIIFDFTDAQHKDKSEILKLAINDYINERLNTLGSSHPTEAIINE